MRRLLGVTLLCFLAGCQPVLACVSRLFGEEKRSPVISSDKPISKPAVVSEVGVSGRVAPRDAASSRNRIHGLDQNAKYEYSSHDRVCYSDGICFSRTQRPYNGLPLPIPPVGMPLRYYLYTPESSAVEDLPVTGDSVTFLNDRPLKLFVHGFGMNAVNSLVLEFARKMVYNCQCNVIIVDWRGGSYGGYTSNLNSSNFGARSAMAFSNSRVAARMLGKFLHRLYRKRETIFPHKGLHCIGVDIGAHICAQLQDSFHEPLARISALNPTVPRSCDLECLDPSDAGQVDVIHTTTGGSVGHHRDSVVNLGNLGADDAVGHMDFFVNWQDPIQPRCNLVDPELPQRCSSWRSLELFTLSISESCFYISRSCAKAPTSKCAPCRFPYYRCARMGWMANLTLLGDDAVNQHNGRFFIDTTEDSPYCGTDD